MVVAAGNEGHLDQIWYQGQWYDISPPDNIRTPGDVPSVITVGATTIDDEIATPENTVYDWGSSRGPVEWDGFQDPWTHYNDYPYPPGLMKPDVCAPGVNITSTLRGGGYEGGWEGTSMATPATSGTVALMLEAAPDMTPQMAKDILEATAVELGPAGKDSLYGSGRIDAKAAMELILFPPSIPTGLSIGKYQNHPKLTWNANSDADLIGYNVYRKLANQSQYYNIAFVQAPTTTFIDYELNLGDRLDPQVCYKVRAVDVV